MARVPFMYGRSEMVHGKPGLYELQAAFLGRKPVVYTLEEGVTIEVELNTIRPPHRDRQNWRLTGWIKATNQCVQIEHCVVGDSWARIASEQISSLISVAPNPQRIVHGPGRFDLASAIIKGQMLEFDLRSGNQQPSMGAQQLALRAIHATAYPDVWQIEATYAGEHADIECFVLQYNDAIRSGWLHNEC